MPKQTFYLTAAIPYVNGKPHIGHALELVQADVVARYNRIIGHETFFSTGVDENSLKNVRAAEAAGSTTQEFCDQRGEKGRRRTPPPKGGLCVHRPVGYDGHELRPFGRSDARRVLR